MTRFGRLLCLLVALGGFAAAHVLVQTGSAMQLPVPTVSVPVPPVPLPPVPVPPVPVPTVPVPPVPTPTVPVPPVPAPPVPVPTVPVPVPIPVPVPVPAPALPARPAPPPAPGRPAVPALPSTPTVAPTAPALRSAPGTASGDAASPSPGTPVVLAGSTPAPAATSAPAGRKATTGPRQLEARRLKTRGRVSVRLAFTLPKAERIFVIVRGPAPSCEIAGYIPVRGRKGSNKVAFAGRVHGRRLDPGVYLLSLSPNRRLVPGAATEYVRVVSPRRSLPVPDSARKPTCTDASVSATDTTTSTLLAGAQPPRTEPTVRPAPAKTPRARDGDEDDDQEAAGFIPDAGVLGVATGDGAAQPFVAIAVLTLIGALLLAMFALVTRFLRGSWNP